MNWLLAQAPIPEEVKELGKAIGEAVGRGVEKGLESSAQAAPTNWVQMVVAVTGFILALAIVVAFLWFLSKLLAKLDQAAAENREHIETMTATYAERDREAQRSCHEHSMEMLNSRNEGNQILRESVKEVKEVASDFKVIAHDFRNIATETKGLVEMALDEHKSRTVVVNQPLIQPAPKPPESAE